MCPEEVPNIYNDAKKLQQTHEDPLYYSGRFFDKIIGKNYEEKELDGQGDIVYHIISQYVRSLLYGCNHLHQSLARLLSVSFLEVHRTSIQCFTTRDLILMFPKRAGYQCTAWAL